MALKFIATATYLFHRLMHPHLMECDPVIKTTPNKRKDFKAWYPIDTNTFSIENAISVEYTVK